MKAIHISEIPKRLIQRRDRWRNFWQWIPIAGALYHKFFYVDPMNKWLDEHKVDMIIH